MDDAALVAWLLDVLRKTPDVYLHTPPGGVTADTTLKDGLGIDSIGRICVFYGVVDALGIDGEESAVETWSTVGDVLAFVRARSC